MAAPTYFGSASNPSDNGSANEPTTLSVTPPGSMQSGDLVVFFGLGVAGSAATISDAGGQTWNSENAATNTNGDIYAFWCQFNGTWSADPSIAFATAGGTVPVTAVLHVFRPSSSNVTWQSSGRASSGFNAPSSPFTVTNSLINTNPTVNDNVGLACFVSADDNTWNSLTGSGAFGSWALTGSAQYRNTAGADMSAVFAHQLQSTAGAYGTLSINQATLGGDAGTKWQANYAAVPNAGTVVKDLIQSGVIAFPR